MKDKLKQSIVAITSANLKRILYARQMSQRELALKANIPVPTISRYFLGNGAITSKNLVKIAKVLNVEPDEIDPSYQSTSDFLATLSEKSDDPQLNFRADYLKQLIQNSHLSIHEIADKLDLKAVTVYKWLTGVSSPNKDNTAKLAALFNISVDYLTDSSTISDLTPQQTQILKALPKDLTNQQVTLIISLIKSVLDNTN
ncbi:MULTISPECIES: helix-turn-helix transcriptional regulator [Lactobacillus]|uniref:XRE family transcriptional regulator n=1 Tax=Lactobacillus xujianguonis TaxID=2495899 RepID=A0A437SWL1_9LACO|nr:MULTISPECIES: helix-turn-helix transcriptional regulator [Lactobacillus]RVU71207.1 XRE family transcriptional regulator [Lactobacillus xujianguonis]